MTLTLLLIALAAPQDYDAERFPGKMRLWHNFADGKVLDADEITGWTLAVPKALNFSADQLIIGQRPEDDSFSTRLGKFLLVGAPLGVVEAVINGASHEYGHFRAYSRAGLQDFEFSSADGSGRIDGNPFSAFAVMFRQNVLRSDPIYSADIAGGFENAIFGYPHAAEIRIISEAGGFNQQQYTAEILAEEAMNGSSHFLDSFIYFPNMLSVMLYDSVSSVSSNDNDIVDYEANLAAIGVNVSRGDIVWRSQIPKIFGNSSLAFIAGVADYLATGDKKVEPIRFSFAEDAVIYWPDFASYLTLRGPTFKVIERVDWRNHAFTFTYEQSLADNSQECGFAWRARPTDHIQIGIKAVHNLDTKGRWIEIQPEARVTSWLSLGLKFYYGKGHTFAREVVGNSYHFLEDKEMGLKGFLQISFDF